MKKSLIALIAILFSISALQSQIRVGIRGGFDVISHKINSSIINADNRLGFQTGLTAEFLPINGLGLEMSLLYGHQKYKVEDREEDASISNYNYISIPLNLKKRFAFTDFFGIFLSAGAYGNVKINGKDIDIKDTHNKFKSKNFAMGLNFGFGVKLLKSFDLGLYYRHKLTDNYKEDTPGIGDLNKGHDKNWTVALAYYFN